MVEGLQLQDSPPQPASSLLKRLTLHHKHWAKSTQVKDDCDISPHSPAAQRIPKLGKSALKSKTNNYKNKQIKKEKKKEKKESIDKANSDLTMAEVYYVQVLWNDAHQCYNHLVTAVKCRVGQTMS